MNCSFCSLDRVLRIQRKTNASTVPRVFKFHDVKKGFRSRIYFNYEACEAQVKYFSGAQFKSFGVMTKPYSS